MQPDSASEPVLPLNLVTLRLLGWSSGPVWLPLVIHILHYWVTHQ
jgi:hypothetical protein